MNRFAAVVLSGLVSFGAFAGPAEDKGLEIAQETDRRDTGFGDFKVDMVMLLKNRHGQESTRYLRNRTLEGQGDGDKTLLIFDRPRDVKGTALLTFTHKQGQDDQWLYLPALKRVKRIASQNKSGPFMGSEFAYEDLSSQEVEKYTYKYVKDEACGELQCFVNERVPVDENSGYTRQLVWVDKTEYRPMRVEFYDRRNSLLKVLEFRGYQQYLDQFWRADELYMENKQNGKSTLLSFKGYRFGNGFKDSDFNRNTLKRVR